MDQPQPLTSHLEELRKRLIIILLAFLALSGVSFFYVERILAWLAEPVGAFIFTAPAEAFLVRLKIGFCTGALLTFPVAIVQLWSFVETGLSTKERFLVRAAVPAASILFYIGIALGLLAVAPAAMRFFLTFGTPELRPLISIQSYLSFVFWTILAFGALFQLPLIVIAVCYLGIVTPAQLAAYRKHIFVGIIVAGAVLTPGPDVLSQFLLAAPAYLLFEVALLIARRFRR